MIEKKFVEVSPQSFTSNGGTEGEVHIALTILFKVKQQVLIASNTQIPIKLEVKRINSPTQLQVGPIGGAMVDNWTDISAYLVADSARIFAEEQPRPNLSQYDVWRAVYEEEPTVALRTMLVDPFGNKITDNNPLPISFDGTISIGEVEVVGTNGNTIEPNTDGSLNVVVQNPSGTSGNTKNTYNSVTAVASSVTTTIVSYTVPIGKTAVLERIACSGDNFASYSAQINGTEIDARLTWYANFNSDFDFISGGKGYPLASGDVVRLRVTHTRPYVGNFNARIQVVESL